MKKLIVFLAIMILCTANAFTQITITENKCPGGNYPFVTVTNIDSAVNQTTTYFSVDQLSETTYYHFYYSSTANDSLMVIVLGRANTYLTGWQVDTFFVKALNNYELEATPTYHLNQCALMVIPYNSVTGSDNIGDVVDDGIFYFEAYSTAMKNTFYQSFQKAPK